MDGLLRRFRACSRCFAPLILSISPPLLFWGGREAGKGFFKPFLPHSPPPFFPPPLLLRGEKKKEEGGREGRVTDCKIVLLSRRFFALYQLSLALEGVFRKPSSLLLSRPAAANTNEAEKSCADVRQVFSLPLLPPPAPDFQGSKPFCLLANQHCCKKSPSNSSRCPLPPLPLKRKGTKTKKKRKFPLP